MTLMPKSEYSVKWLRISDLSIVWASAQRGLQKSKVETIKVGFNPDAIGVIATTLPNGKGVHHVIDGQHRVAAVRELWGDSERVPCMVLNGKTEAEAAHIWSLMNSNRTMPQPVDRFKVAVTAGYEDEVEVNKIVSDLGYRVSMGSTDGELSAIVSCLAVYRKHGSHALTWALGTIQETWGKTRDSVNGAIIRAYAEVLSEYPTVERPRIVSKVAKQYTPGRLLGAARTAKEFFKGTLHDNIVKILVQTYDHGLRTGARLDDAT